MGPGFRLALVPDGPGIPVGSALAWQRASVDSEDEIVEAVRVEQFSDSEMVAKDAADRRFPVTRPVRRTEGAPKWWMDRYGAPPYPPRGGVVRPPARHTLEQC